MNNLVDEVIDIRKQDQGYLKLKISKENIVAVIEEICGSFYSYAQLNKIDLRFSSTLKEADLYIDKTQIEKVFYNLLSNAFKYTKPGDWISVELSAEGDNDIVISVNNLGVGIDKSKIKHVFERFWQDDSATTTRTVKGSGIGLAMAKGIVELHQGTIGVESELNGVTSFTVTLHRDANMNMEASSSADEPVAEHYIIEPQEISEMVKPDKTVKILIVEDNPEMRKVLTQIFEQIYEVYTAADGQEGLERASSLQPQMIVSDIMMPVMSGLEMCEKLKSNLQTSHIPVVLLTARNREEHTLEGLQTGADDYISKPFSIAVLTSKIQNMMRTRRHMLEKYAKSLEVEPEKITFNAMDEELLKRAVSIVEENIDNFEFSTDEFAQKMNMSRSNLHLKLKAITGESAIDFIRKVRFKRATELLKSGRYTVTEVSSMVGFNSSSYFATCFKKYIGCLPTEYIKKVKG